MRTTIKTIIILSLLWAIVVGHVAAFNVTPSGAGTTWITWDWDNPSNVTEMRIDGALLCGYESTLPSVNVIGMRSNTCHNLSIISNVADYGLSDCERSHICRKSVIKKINQARFSAILSLMT